MYEFYHRQIITLKKKQYNLQGAGILWMESETLNPSLSGPATDRLHS